MRLIFCALLLTSCAHQTHTVGGIASVVKQNEILAYNDYVYSNIIITGKIIDIGVDSKLDKAVTQAVATGDSIYIYKKDKNIDLHPFVVIADNALSYDVAICFFTFSSAKDMIRYRRGDTVHLYGMVYRFVTLRKRTILVLDNCEEY